MATKREAELEKELAAASELLDKQLAKIKRLAARVATLERQLAIANGQLSTLES